MVPLRFDLLIGSAPFLLNVQQSSRRMTVTTQLNGHNIHGPDDDLMVVARAVGVSNELDITTRYVPELDQTGGMEVLTEILREKTDAFVQIAEADYARQRALKAASEPKAAGPLRRTWRRLASWAARAIQTVRDAATWLTPSVETYRTWKADKVRRAYKPRHGREVAWYGAQRSTSQLVAAARRTRRATPTDQEPALPAHFVSFIALAMDAARGHDEVLRRPHGGYQYRCS